MDLRQIRSFVAVAEELHFHKAARRLGIAQPALSRTIKKLEADLDVTLLMRTNRKVELTDAGRTLLKGGREILGLTQRLGEELHQRQLGKKGTLRLGYTDNAINGAAPRLLRAFQTTHPDIDMQLHHMVTATQLNRLDDDAIDLGFATGQQAPPGYESICIQKEQFICLVYDGHPLAGQEQVHLRDLAQEPMVRGVPAEWEHFHAYLRPSFLRAGFEPIIAQEGLTTASIQRLVACGMGVAILTETVTETLVPGVKALTLKGVSDWLATMVLWKPDPSFAAKTRFVAFLRDELNSAAAG